MRKGTTPEDFDWRRAAALHFGRGGDGCTLCTVLGSSIFGGQAVLSEKWELISR